MSAMGMAVPGQSTKNTYGLSLSPPQVVNAGAEDEKDKKSGKDKKKKEEVTIRHGASFRPAPRRGLRAFLECGLIVGVSQANYWRRYINWIEDWQFEFNWEDQTSRLFTGEGWRFDSNAFFTNWGHALAGAVYYNAYRTNYMPWSRAMLYSALTSFYWELLVEWREVISINDNIVTVMAGFPIGETLFQTGSFLQTRKGWLARIAGGVINPLRAVNRWFDRRLEFPAPQFSTHRFRIYAGRRSGKNLAGEPDQQFLELGLTADLTRVPGFGVPGALNEWRSDILSTHLGVNIVAGKDGIEEYEALARTMPWGWVNQNLVQGPDGGVRGHSLVAGIFTAFELYGQRPVWEYDTKNPFFQPWLYDQIPLPTRFTDKYCAAHLFGPRIVWRYHGRGYTFTAAADASLDFSMVNALALTEYTRENSVEGMKSTLANYGYYYGLGLSTSIELELSTRWGLDVEAWARTWVQNSIEGVDRFADYIDDNMNIHDSRSRLGAALGYRIPGSPLQVRLVLENVTRRGRMSGVTSRQEDSRLSMHICYGF